MVEAEARRSRNAGIVAGFENRDDGYSPTELIDKQRTARADPIAGGDR